MEGMKPERRESAESKFEIPKFTAEAAAVLAVLAGPVQATAGEQKGMATEAFDHMEQVVDNARHDATNRFMHQVLNELKKRGVPEQADAAAEKIVPIAVDEILQKLNGLNKALDAETNRRGLDQQ